MQQTVGVIGLGLMGEVLAGRLMAAGFRVVGTTSTRRKMRGLPHAAAAPW
jgi:3-hydroxyisobutyrate dehydrogenase-like beta-hydroxyacid dehydrogenase